MKNVKLNLWAGTCNFEFEQIIMLCSPNKQETRKGKLARGCRSYTVTCRAAMGHLALQKLRLELSKIHPFRPSELSLTFEPRIMICNRVEQVRLLGNVSSRLYWQLRKPVHLKKIPGACRSREDPLGCDRIAQLQKQKPETQKIGERW